MDKPSTMGNKTSGAEKYGGIETDDEFDSNFLNKQYYDKGSHKERSKIHAPQHNEHWRKSGESAEK